jgi:hypothetical protein
LGAKFNGRAMGVKIIIGLRLSPCELSINAPGIERIKGINSIKIPINITLKKKIENIRNKSF